MSKHDNMNDDKLFHQIKTLEGGLVHLMQDRDRKLVIAHKMAGALREVGDKENWGTLDGSGCPKDIGESDESWLGKTEIIKLANVVLAQWDEVNKEPKELKI